MTHFVSVCEYGYTHGQCRCSSKDKAVKPVKCNTVEHVKNPYYEPKHVKR